LDGIPFRKIADQIGKTLGSTYRGYEEFGHNGKFVWLF